MGVYDEWAAYCLDHTILILGLTFQSEQNSTTTPPTKNTSKKGDWLAFFKAKGINVNRGKST